MRTLYMAIEVIRFEHGFIPDSSVYTPGVELEVLNSDLGSREILPVGRHDVTPPWYSEDERNMVVVFPQGHGLVLGYADEISVTKDARGKRLLYPVPSVKLRLPTDQETIAVSGLTQAKEPAIFTVVHFVPGPSPRRRV